MYRIKEKIQCKLSQSMLFLMEISENLESIDTNGFLNDDVDKINRIIEDIRNFKTSIDNNNWVN